jgi:hypothetical protein
VNYRGDCRGIGKNRLRRGRLLSLSSSITGYPAAGTGSERTPEASVNIAFSSDQIVSVSVDAFEDSHLQRIHPGTEAATERMRDH